NSEEYFFLDSMNCGCVRFTNKFFTSEDTGPVPPKVYRKICAKVRNQTRRTINHLKTFAIDLAVGSSGTIENLAEIALRLKDPESHLEALPPHERFLNYNDLTKLAELLCSLPLEKRRELPGINPQRAEVIVAGAAIIQTLMSELELENILVSSRGLQDGILLDTLRKNSLSLLDEHMPVRELSVLQLARLCRAQKRHAEHVKHLALNLFDCARILGLIQPQPHDRELLSYTALLHDVGTLLSLKNHPAHSCYFIRNAEMAGFYDEEIEIMAGGAYCHGKKSLAKEYLSSCSETIRDVVTLNGALLRFCEALDRSHRSLISQAELLMDGKRYVLLLQGVSEEECSVELAAAQNDLSSLKTAFGKVDKEFELRFKPTGPVSSTPKRKTKASEA
ncbi:MAG: Ppx/GppA family phosphatase, partial [Fretibacterium sp.]|nr:Ppx/GppA family phosphatase [Fretibacterium sp.]